MSPKSWASDRWPENLFTEKLPQIMENFMVANGMNYSINNQLQFKIFYLSEILKKKCRQKFNIRKERSSASLLHRATMSIKDELEELNQGITPDTQLLFRDDEFKFLCLRKKNLF
jgi:hypothetical protein